MEYSQLIKQDNKLILWSIPIVLFLSHLSINTYFPNLIINMIGIMLVTITLILICRNLKLPFSIVLAFLITHYQYKEHSCNNRNSTYCLRYCNDMVLRYT